MPGPAASAFLFLGAAILAGFLGHAIFRRHRVSDILVLLGVGYVLGPMFGLLDPSWLTPAMPVLAPLGLAIILFEGGLGLKWDEIRKHGSGALGFSLLSWGATVTVLALVAMRVLGFPPHLAWLFGAAVGATGIVAVIPILAQVNAPAKARVWLTVETGLGDLLSAVAVTGLASLYVFGGGPSSFAVDFGMRFLLGGAVGFLSGLLFARILDRVRERGHAYPLTLAGLLVAFAVTELLGGSGYLSALVFGVVVGNAGPLMREGGVPALASLSDGSRQHQGELIFLLRSIYFVFLGMSLGAALATWQAVVAGVALTGALVTVRILVVSLTHRGDRDTRILITGMMPRAMAAAVLASLPVAMGVPGSEALLPATLLVIVGSDIATTFGLFVYERRRGAVVVAPSVPAVSP